MSSIPLKSIDCAMDEDEEEMVTLSKTSSTITLTQQNVQSLSHDDQKQEIIPQCQIFTQQASGDSMESEESYSISAKVSPKYSLLSKSPHSSSSQEDYEPDSKKSQFLTATTTRHHHHHRVETAKSMESLRTSSTSRSFLSASERDMRHIYKETTNETKSLEHLEREMKLKRYAISNDGSSTLSSADGSDETISAEKRRGLWSGKMRVPQHLSLPPPAGYLNLSPGDRKLTILSPHSPQHRIMPDLLHLSQTNLKSRRKKGGQVLPRLVLPRSESEISEVFSEHGLE